MTVHAFTGAMAAKIRTPATTTPNLSTTLKVHANGQLNVTDAPEKMRVIITKRLSWTMVRVLSIVTVARILDPATS